MTKKSKPSRLGEQNIDDLGDMVLALLTELWIVRDRLAIMEKLLTQRGGLHPGEIEDFQPDKEFSAQLDAMRERLVTEVIGAPLLTEGMKVDEILARAGLTRPKSEKAQTA